jgi:hypothetical protein
VKSPRSMVRAPVQSPAGNGLSSLGQSPKARVVVLMTEGALVESADQMKQQLAAGLSEGQVAEFVENERSPSGVTQEAEHRISRWVDRMAAGFTEPRCASERGLAMGGGRPAERRFTVGGSGKSVARCHRTVLAYWEFESISLQRGVSCEPDVTVWRGPRRCGWPGPSFSESGLTFGAPIDYDKLIELDAKGWELYNLNEDFSETNNLGETERDRLIAMIGMWYAVADLRRLARSYEMTN